MAVLPLVRYPDPVLKRRADAVGDLTDELRTLADDLVDTMRHGPATVGLAAPQVGASVRVFCLDVSSHPKAVDPHGLVILYDPEILETEGTEMMREGCLSVPDLTANVPRARGVVVRGLDPGGRERVYRMEGFEARALQHEVDHLDGTLILDRVESSLDVFPRKTYR